MEHMHVLDSRELESSSGVLFGVTEDVASSSDIFSGFVVILISILNFISVWKTEGSFMGSEALVPHPLLITWVASTPWPLAMNQNFYLGIVTIIADALLDIAKLT